MPVASDAVSVVMPVRNAMPFLDAAIESILAQTHGNFELIVGDDGSTDGSGERLDQWARLDRRIRLLRHDDAGLGPAGSSNWVAGHARNALIARMDADDIAMPGRLEAQVRLFRERPEAAVVGSLSDYVDAAGQRIARRDRSVFRDRRCVFPCAHGSLMFRREIFERIGGYRPQCDYWEDVDLFLRMEREGRVLILPEVLYRYRVSPTSTRHVSNEARVARALELCVQCVAARNEGRDYEMLIEEHHDTAPRQHVSLSVLALVALERLWRGEPRSISKSWAWQHVTIRGGLRNVRILVFMAWLWLNPASLRAFLRLRTRFSDWRARHVVPDGTVHIWHNGAARGPGNGRNVQIPAGPPAHNVLFVESLPAAPEPLLAAAGPARFSEPAGQSLNDGA